MAQIVKTVNDVIVNALYLTGELGVGETPDGFMLETGLDLCNEILSKFSSDSIYVTFLTAIDFDFVVVIVSANDGDSENDLPVVLVTVSANDGDSENDF